MANDNVFSTRDIYLASTLVTLGFNTIGVDFQVEGARKMPVGYFNFEASQELFNTEKKYWRGDLAVDPRIFITNMKGLKSQVNNYYKSPRSNYDDFKKKEK